MKKLIIAIIAMALPLAAGAQAQIKTKKMKIDDFTAKTTKVVLTGGGMYDQILQEEIRNTWKVSPYEFCTVEEFEALKDNQAYYFLITSQGKFKKEKEPGIDFITLVKGGLNGGSGISDMLELVSVPLRSSEEPSGREYIFLPALLDIIQNHAVASMEKDLTGYMGLSQYSTAILKAQDKTMAFSAEDLSEEVGLSARALYFKDIVDYGEADDIDEHLADNDKDVLVSYTVAPSSPTTGSVCYKMLIDCGTHKLYYFKKHKITAKNGPGFLLEDIRICTVRNTK
ncbi:MAG: hypothetical protein HUJ94_06300 [Bacteroidales bacterium]|nr:hypothetical protein [Bacteroidales bacterium]